MIVASTRDRDSIKRATIRTLCMGQLLAWLSAAAGGSACGETEMGASSQIFSQGTTREDQHGRDNAASTTATAMDMASGAAITARPPQPTEPTASTGPGAPSASPPMAADAFASAGSKAPDMLPMSSSEPPSCPADSSWTPGDRDGTIDVGGELRSYILHVPTGYDGTTPMPLLFDFPALTQGASSQRASSGNAALGDAEGFISVFPQGVGNAFNICPESNPTTNCRCCTDARTVDDLGFTLQLLEKLKSEGCIDPKRVYATGYSMGGGMDYFLACYAADKFAAIGPSAFDMVVMDQIPCVPARPISVASFRGTADGVVEYGGSVSSYGLMFQGAVGSWEMWAEINGCTGEPEDIGEGCQSYKQCAAPGVEVTLCTAQGGGHSAAPAPLLWNILKNYALP
jgi:poly(3-hydroxybutyrate) depolymerase